MYILQPLLNDFFPVLQPQPRPRAAVIDVRKEIYNAIAKVGKLCKKQKLPIYGIVQFVELKDGQVFDFTEHGAGFRKEIKR